MGDHTECFQVDFDPRQLSYAELLREFLSDDHFRRRPWSIQYRSMILYHSEAQRQAAEAALAESERRGPAHVHLAPAGTFTRGEDYHQKYYLRGSGRLEAEYTRLYPELDAFVDSTAVARANAYVAGQGEAELVRRNLPLLGLTPEGEATLLKLARLPAFRCG